MEVECTFNCVSLDNSAGYSCTVSNAIITEPNTTIKNFIGVNHSEGKSDKVVTDLIFSETFIEYVPKGLINFFPNLRSLAIRSCGLKEISRRDLIGLENLQDLQLSSNQLTLLPINLFANMKKLKTVSFRNNQLEFVSSEMLSPILTNGLQLVDFSLNKAVNACFKACRDNVGSNQVLSIEDLIEEIDEQCKSPVEAQRKNSQLSHSKRIVKGFNMLRGSGKLFDLTIKAGSLEFPVHKNVLALQSSVFAAMMEHEMEERVTKQIEITDFSDNAVKELLDFLYTGEINDETYAMELFAAAAKYDLEELKTICEEIIVENIDELNAIEILVLGNLYNSEDMKYLAFQEITGFFVEKKISKNFMHKPEFLIKLVEAEKLRKMKIEEAQNEFEIAFRDCSINI